MSLACQVFAVFLKVIYGLLVDFSVMMMFVSRADPGVHVNLRRVQQCEALIVLMSGFKHGTRTRVPVSSRSVELASDFTSFNPLAD